MRHFHILFAAIAFVLASVPNMSRACSVVDDYRVPTNLELAGQSELILRGRVIGESVGEDAWDRTLLVEPLEAVKGVMPSGTVQIDGSGLVPEQDDRGFGLLSNPYELEGAHPLSYIGGCIRYMFPKGTTVLFFLEQREGKWRPAGGPFSRWAEDVVDPDTPWMQLTRFYASVPVDDTAQRKAMLEAERDRLGAMANDPIAALMAADVARQLAGPNEAWNAIMQKAIAGEGDIPPGAEAEVSASALTEFVMEAEAAAFEAEALMLEEALEQGCDVDENGQLINCESASGTQGGQDELVVCVLAADGRSVDCDGVIFSKTETNEDGNR